jgi:hypothetical protein
MVVRYVAALGVLAPALAGCGQDAASKRPDWLTEKFEKNLIRAAVHLKERDKEATVTRAFVVRATDKQVQRLGGWRSPGRDRVVYVLEVWGDMELCHTAPRGADPCTRTNGWTAVFASKTLEPLEAAHVMTFRLGAERLCCGGRPYDLDISAKP